MNVLATLSRIRAFHDVRPITLHANKSQKTDKKREKRTLISVQEELERKLKNPNITPKEKRDIESDLDHIKYSLEKLESSSNSKKNKSEKGIDELRVQKLIADDNDDAENTEDNTDDTNMEDDEDAAPEPNTEIAKNAVAKLEEIGEQYFIISELLKRVEVAKLQNNPDNIKDTLAGLRAAIQDCRDMDVAVKDALMEYLKPFTDSAKE